MTGRYFVDANVFVYTHDHRDPRKHALALKWLDRLWQERSGCTSIQVLSEFYAVATRKLAVKVRPDVAWQYVERYLSWLPQPVDETLLRRAREVELRYKLSWWDSMVVAAAQLQDCDVLLTEDLQHGAAYGEVKVHSPFIAVLEEPRAPYAYVTHRSRGRPRKPGFHVTNRA
jgi:predicted nucleic acid-binding protein